MDEQLLQEGYLLERVTDPTTPEFAELMQTLIAQPTDGRTRQEKLSGKGEFRYTLPFKGDATVERWVMDNTSFAFAERGFYRNGVVSLAVVYAELVGLVVASSGRSRVTPTLVVTADVNTLQTIMYSAGPPAPFIHYCGYDNVADALVVVRPETMVFDHTSINCPLDTLLNLAYRAGVQVVDGIFPHHSAVFRGRDVVAGNAKWSYTHVQGGLYVGPDDDPGRIMYYTTEDMRKFTDPVYWRGKSRTYGYEIRKYLHGLCTYRAVYSGMGAEVPIEKLSFKLPLTSADDLALVVINRDLASGVFASDSVSALDMASLERNYAIEVRRDLLVSCIDYLVSQTKGADIVGDAVRYINQHNYVDLVDGVRLVRCHALNYTDALCVAMVCALTAYSLRYRLTAESIPDVRRSVAAAKMLVDPPLGAIGRLAWLFGTYVSDAVGEVYIRTRDAAVARLYNSDYIPGVCFDLYLDRHYVPDAEWFMTDPLEREEVGQPVDDYSDPFVKFLGRSEKTAAPSLFPDDSARVESKQLAVKPVKYVPNFIPDPVVAIQHVYDQAFPGNSVSFLQNAAELKRVRDVNINTEFYGRIEVNKDIAAPERLHGDAAIRTAALPISRTPLLDAIMASAKRNFNPPDIQVQNNCFAYARYLVDRFKEHFFVPNYKEILAGYQKDMLTFNIEDYLDWLASRDTRYRSALESECPEELVELQMERYDTIVKQRIKPKLSVGAQFELSQPQVIVSLAKRDTALFTSLFRVVFKRLEALLRDGVYSAGRASDQDISDWLTQRAPRVFSCKAVELDSSKYDKSQNMLARMIESYLYTDLGLDPQVMDIFSESFVGKVSSRNLGLVFILAYQMKSGAPNTMLGNSVYNAVSAGESLGWSSILMMILKGDDNVAWLRDSVKPDLVVAKMSGLFNLEVKLILDSVLYFSSGFIAPVGSGAVFAPDPLKIAELLGEIGGDERMLLERFVSFQDRVSSLVADSSLPLVLQGLMRHRLQVPDLDVVMLIDALAAIAESFSTYKRVVTQVH